MKTYMWLIASVVVLASFAAWSLWRYYSHGTVTLSDGTVVQDVSIAEAGELAGSAHLSSRKAHYERANFFKNARRIPVESPAAASDVVGPIFDEALQSNPAGMQVLQSAPDGATDGLRSLVARVVSVLAGAEQDAYVASHPDRNAFGSPIGTDADELGRIADYYGVSYEVPEADAPSAAWWPVFDAIYELPHTYRDGEFLLRGVLIGDDTFLVAVAPQARREPGTALAAQHGRELEEFFYSASAQAQINFFFRARGDEGHGADGHSHGATDDPRNLEADVVIVIEDHSGDVYPIDITARYDAARERWTLYGVAKLSSVKAMSGPPFVF